MNAQTDKNHREIDSIHKFLSKTKSIDSILIARQHYRIGELFRYSLISDSSYYYFQKAEKVFRKLGYKYDTALALYGIAVIQTYDKDYTGSEVTSFEAISLLEGLSQTNKVRRQIAYIYNNLGIVFDELELYEESIKYFKKIT